MEVEVSGVSETVAERIFQASIRFDNYCREAADLERKLANGGSSGKQGKRQFRLNDIQTRLLPQVVKILS